MRIASISQKQESNVRHLSVISMWIFTAISYCKEQCRITPFGCQDILIFITYHVNIHISRFTLGKINKKTREQVVEKLLFKFSYSFSSIYKVYYKSDGKGKGKNDDVYSRICKSLNYDLNNKRHAP